MKSLVRRTHPRASVAAVVAVAVVMLVFAVAPALAGPPVFSAPAGFTVGDSPHAVAVGDFNRDGKTDVATASHTGSTISVLLGQGNGKLGTAKSVTVGLHPSAIVAADFNGDGKLDLAVANNGSNTVSILRGDGAGGFTLVQTVAVGAGPMSIASGDLNNDGRPDLAVTCYTGGTLSVLTQNPGGIFVALTLAAPPAPPFIMEGPRAIVIADANRDGNADIVFTTFYRRYDSDVEDLGVYYGNGSGGFSLLGFLGVNVPEGVMDLSVSDVNHDGLTEIFGASWTTDQVWMSVESGVGSALFTTPNETKPAYSKVGYPGAMIVKDFNGDGIPDLAVTLPTKDEIAISLSRWRGQPLPVPVGGLPSWTLAQDPWTRWTLVKKYPAGDRPGPMVAADMNGDGTDDLVVGDYGSDKVSILTKTAPIRDGVAFEPAVQSSIGTGAEFARMAIGDLDLDGAPDLVSTLSSYAGDIDAGTFGTATAHAAGDDVCLADVNRDGLLDLVSAETATDRVSVALGTGSGGFAAASMFATGAGPVRVMTADVNHDGKLDIVTTNGTAGSVSVLLGDGAGSFAAHVDTAVDASPLGVAAGDINRDGKLDLVVADNGGATVSVLLGDGAGGFTKTDVTVGASPAAVGLGDFNRDGKLDLVAGTSTGDVSILPGDGNGGFGTAVTVASPAGATELAIGDFTTDGRLDVAATDPHAGGSYGVSLLVGNGALGLSVKANLQVPGNVISGLATADLNDDGAPDLVVGSHDPANAANGRVYEFVDDTLAPVTDSHVRTTVRISGGGGTGAVAQPVLWTGKVAQIVIIDSGSGYTSTPTVTISGGGGSGATAAAVVAAGGVSAVNMTSFGSGYLTPVANSNNGDPVDGMTYWINHTTTLAQTSSDDGAGPADTWFQYKTAGFVKGAKVTISAPADHSADGVNALRPYSDDKVGNVEDWWPYMIGVDTTKPKLDDNAAAGWTNAPVTTLNLTASDNDGGSALPLGSRIKITSWGYSVQPGQSEGSATLLVPAPYDHANDGLHAITFSATDNAGNTGTKTCYVRVDTARPTVSVSAAFSVKAGGFVALKYRVNDGAPSCGAATVKVIIRNSRGSTVAVWPLGKAKVGKWLTFVFPTPGARGTYSCSTYATDLAGNVQQKAGQTKLTLK